ncbi:hypothetical protein LWJ97_003636 [Escherichia coli]|nr:hypothetical protein [Escherichia coli]
MGSCAAPSAKGDDKFITTDYLQQCRWKRQKHGDGLPVLRPGQTGSSLPEKGLNTATGAAGEGCNEKSSLHYSRDSEG